MRTHLSICFLAASSALLLAGTSGPTSPSTAQAATWRTEHRTIDMHQHIDCTTQHLARAITIMDAVGIGLAVNLSGDTVTPGKDGGPSEFERNKALADALYPGRFLHYMNLDYQDWD